MLSWIVFLYGIAFAANSLKEYIATTPNTYSPHPSYQDPIYAQVQYMHIALLLTVFFALPSILLPRMHHLRTAAASTFFMYCTLTSVLLSFMMEKTGLYPPVDFASESVISIFSLGICSAVTSVTFGGLPEVEESGLHIAHVRAVEVAAFGVASLAVCGFNIEAQRQVLFVVFPQVGALVVPFLFSYFASLSASRNQKFFDKDVEDS